MQTAVLIKLDKGHNDHHRYFYKKPPGEYLVASYVSS